MDMTDSVQVTGKSENAYEEIRELLVLCDNDFLPPLSKRESTSQADLSGIGVAQTSVERYLDGIKEQCTLVTRKGGKVVGFLSFKMDYTSEDIAGSTLPNIYITTVIVHPDERGKGLSKEMYLRVTNRFKDRRIFTRTWSTNNAHIHVLSKMGFVECLTKENDRGWGIDTIYFCREP